MAKAKRLTKNKNQALKIPKELISASEFARRKKVWKQHYDKAQESDACKRIMKQRQALKDGDMTTVKKLAREARKEITNGKVSSRPPFPDPNLERLYGRLGVNEYWEQKIQEAKESGMEIKTVG